VFRHIWGIGVVVLYGLVLCITAAAGTPDRPVPAAPTANLLDKPLGEDGFYMLSVARSLAEGGGLSYGQVATTGVQPLATIVYAGVYRVSGLLSASADLPLRAVIFLNVLVLAAVGLLSGRLVASQLRGAGAADSHAIWIVAGLIVVNTAAFRLFTYGLETGIYLLCLVLVQLAMHRRQPPWVVGGLCGLCFLARVDFAIIAIVVVGIDLLRGRHRLRDVMVMTIAAGVVASPWMLYVVDVTGGVMPSSGASQSGLIGSIPELAARGWSMLSALIIAATAVFYLPILDGTMQRVVVAVLAIAIAAGVWVMRGEIAVTLRVQWPWLAGAAVVAVYYAAASYAVHFYPRYIAPLWLVWVQVLGGAVAIAASRWRLAPPIVAALPAALVLIFAVQIGYTLHRGAAGNTHLFTGFYIERHHTALGTVGAFQSGVVGYMTREQTINLDGKLDGRALAWRDLLRLECYLAERGVTTLIDWDANIRNGWIDRAFVDTRMREIDRVEGGASIVMHVDATGLECPAHP
jgi:hypothetical protein